jgi:hypothetical protein
LLHFYRRMLALRRTTPALIAGEFTIVAPDSAAYLAFLRHDRASKQTCLVLLNFSDAPQPVHVELGAAQAEVRFAGAARSAGAVDHRCLTLAPFEILIVEVVDSPPCL